MGHRVHEENRVVKAWDLPATRGTAECTVLKELNTLELQCVQEKVGIPSTGLFGSPMCCAFCAVRTVTVCFE